MRYLGIDIGSTTIKAAILNLATSQVGTPQSIPFPLPVPRLPHGWFEVDPRAVVHGVRSLLEQGLDQAPDCLGILFSSQMGGLVLADLQGRPVSNYFSWRDQRVLQPVQAGQPNCFEELLSRTTPEQRQRIGHELKPGGATSLLYWLQDAKQLPPHPVQALSLGDIVVSQLTGTTPRAEATMALGLLNLDSRQWATDWFSELNLAEIQFPQLIDFHQPVGELHHSGRQYPCYPAVGDHQAALHGAALTAGELSINVSTGSQVSLLIRNWMPGDYQTRPFFGGQYLNTVTHLPAGRSLNALLDLLTEIASAAGLHVPQPWDVVSRLIHEATGPIPAIDLAFFASSVGDRGHLQQLTLENLHVGHIFLGAFENMADNYRQCADRLSPSADYQRLVLSGGLPQKLERLATAICRRFSVPARMVDSPEETLQGLLNLARSL